MPTMPGSFRPGGQRSERERRRDDDRRRGSARARGYTARWDREARAHRRAHPLCVGCQAMGRVVPATVVDHVEPHRGDAAKFWEPANRQSACDWHHDVVKQRLEAMFDRGEIGIGELRLDSATALRLSGELAGVTFG